MEEDTVTGTERVNCPNGGIFREATDSAARGGRVDLGSADGRFQPVEVAASPPTGVFPVVGVAGW